MPRSFIAENVSGLVKGVAKGYFLEILAALKGCGYRIAAKVLDAQWLGVPQHRQRVIFIGIREDLQDTAGILIQSCHPIPLPWRYSVRDAIPWITEGEMVTAGNERHTLAGRTPTWHISEPSPTIMASVPGFSILDRETSQSLKLDRSRIKACNGQNVFGCVNPAKADKPCPTVQTVAHDTPLADERRKFTLVELRRICSFPDDFTLIGTYAQRWKCLGNAVPPLMMRAIAEAVRDNCLFKAKKEPRR